jgi:hypothetical protein
MLSKVNSIDCPLGSSAPFHSRQAMVDTGEMTRFHEGELSEITEIFGNMANRFDAYEYKRRSV